MKLSEVITTAAADEVVKRSGFQRKVIRPRDGSRPARPREQTKTFIHSFSMPDEVFDWIHPDAFVDGYLGPMIRRLSKNVQDHVYEIGHPVEFIRPVKLPEDSEHRRTRQIDQDGFCIQWTAKRVSYPITQLSKDVWKLQHEVEVTIWAEVTI